VKLPRLWLDGIIRPLKMTAHLAVAPAPGVGFAAVLLRFVVTSLTSILSLYLLGRQPFVPSELVMLPTERYYFAELFFLPFWGLAIWSLMGSFVYLTVRLSKGEADYGKILNSIAVGMLVPMPFLWVWDWTAIALNIYTVTNQVVTHSIAQLWEASIQAICFVKVLRLNPALAIVLAVLANAMYIALAMHFIR